MVVSNGTNTEFDCGDKVYKQKVSVLENEHRVHRGNYVRCLNRDLRNCW
jgi:hypothetical protein